MNKIIILLAIFALTQVITAQKQRAQQSNRCAPACRLRGTCTRVPSTVAGQPATFFCKCDPGWTGRACEKEVQCPVKCTPNGRCVQATTNARPSCVCDSGWTGIDCGTMIDNCKVVSATDSTSTTCPALANSNLYTECMSVLSGYICLPADSYGSCVASGTKVTCDLQDFSKK